MLKFLRIAVTALSFTACFLLVALWVRSYWRLDSFTYIHSIKRVICGHSFPGRCIVFITPQTIAHTPGLQTYPMPQPFDSGMPNSFLGFYYHASPGSTTFAIPYWFLTLSLAMMSAVAGFPWIPRRFSLRVLLIATTLVAVALAAIVYVST
jgi:hypothetical protein